MIEVRNVPAYRVYELANVGHLVETDLFDGIGDGVIVRVQTCKKENDGNTFRCIAEVIASIVDPLRIPRIVEPIVDL